MAASAWAQLSKADQDAWKASGQFTAGNEKKEYNDQYGKGGTKAPPPPSAPAPTPSNQKQINNNQGVEERAKSTPSPSSSLLSSSRNDPIVGPTFEPASSNNEPNRSAAVEKTQKVAGTSNQIPNKRPHDSDPLNTKYSDMSDEYKASTTKTDHKNARKGAGTYTNDKMEEKQDREKNGTQGPGQHATEGLPDYSQLTKDQKKTSGGTKKDYNRRTGTDSPSKWDIKSEYARNNATLEDYQALEDSGTVTDKAALKFLNKKIRQLTPAASTEPPPGDTTLEPTPELSPTQPGGGGNNIIGDGNNTGGGNNTIGGGNNTIGGGNNNGGGNNTGGNTDANLVIDNSFNETIDQIQDVDIDQENQQDFNVTQDNNLNIAITGDNNISDIQQDNNVANYGGNQSNNANVTGSSANTSSSNFLQNYLYGMGAFDSLRKAGIDVGGTLSSIGGNLAETGTTTYTPDYPLTTTPGNTTSNQQISDSYNTTYNQIQDIDSTQGNDQNFNVNQDNDLNAQITGNNNVSQITQDNSVRNYGGDQRNFTYISGQNANGTPSNLTDSQVSAATMAGYYSPSDSPASNAAFVDRYQTMNSDAQKKYNPFGTAEGYMTRSTNMPGTVDTTALKQEINMAPVLAQARADMANLNAYGDQYKAPTVRWNSALGRFEPIEPYDPTKTAEEVRNFANK